VKIACKQASHTDHLMELFSTSEVEVHSIEKVEPNRGSEFDDFKRGWSPGDTSAARRSRV